MEAYGLSIARGQFQRSWQLEVAEDSRVDVTSGWLGPIRSL